MKREFLKGIASGIAIVAVCTGVAMANAGTREDPLISKNYLDDVFMHEVQQYIDTKADSFSVVSLNEGQSIVCSAGCELILRQGKANIIATQKGGIADVTSASDLTNNMAMPANHHLIVPADDGRGITAQSSVLVMVKGNYQVK